jgi:hypothetical protein
LSNSDNDLVGFLTSKVDELLKTDARIVMLAERLLGGLDLLGQLLGSICFLRFLYQVIEL